MLEFLFLLLVGLFAGSLVFGADVLFGMPGMVVLGVVGIGLLLWCFFSGAADEAKSEAGENWKKAFKEKIFAGVAGYCLIAPAMVVIPIGILWLVFKLLFPPLLR